MNGLPALSVRRPVATGMLLVSILVVGMISLQRLPLAYLPEIDVPFILIQVPLPNSSPAQVERDITKPIEEALATLSGIDQISSSSGADGAEIFLEFKWGQELDLVRLRVSEIVDETRGRLPADVGEVVVLSFNTNDIPVVEGRISAKGVDLSENFDLLETRVANRLRRIPGVGRVTLEGVAPKEIFIDLRLDAIAAHDIDVGRLIQRLRSATSRLVLGQVRDGGRRLLARAVAPVDHLDQLARLPIDERGLALAEIADITYEEPPIEYGRYLDGQPAVALSVFKESTANTVQVVREVQRVIRDEIGVDPLLEGISLFVWEDQADEITSALDGLRQSGMAGALLAVLVLYAFLRRIDQTLVVAMSIPFSVLATCAVLLLMGKSLNILSMTGLMLGVGMLVDNAIVVLEAIDRHHRLDPDRRRAALTGAGEVSLAVLASSVTSVIVFLPLIVGSESDLTTWLGEIGFALTLAIVASLLSSLTLIPLVSAHLVRSTATPRGRWLDRLGDLHGQALGWTFDHPWKTFLGLLLVLAIGIAPLGFHWVESAMFAATTNERLRLEFEFQDFHDKAETRRAVLAVEAILAPRRDELGIRSIYSYFAENDAATTLVLAQKGLPDPEVKQLKQRIRALLPKLPGAEVRFDEDADEGGSSTSFAVKLFGPDVEAIEPMAREVERRLELMDRIQDVSSSLEANRNEIQVRLDRERAARLGLSAQEIADVFAFTLGGFRLPRLRSGEREVETWLALRLEDRTNLDDLRAIRIREVGGRPVLLGDIADFEVVPRPVSIRRENRRARVAIRASYEGEEWDEARKRIEDMMNSLALPAGTSWSFNNRILEQDEQGRQMGENFQLALALIYLVMAALFESLVLPFAILFSIPFALPGITWLLALTGTPFNLMAQIGVLILMGIVVNNGIVLLDRMHQLRAEGVPDREAAIAAGHDRLRPILMTTATTIIGLLPLALGGSAVGGMLYFPMARTVMGGMASSLVLTLVVLPFVALRIEAAAKWAKRKWQASAPASGARAAGRRNPQAVDGGGTA